MTWQEQQQMCQQRLPAVVGDGAFVGSNRPDLSASSFRFLLWQASLSIANAVTLNVLLAAWCSMPELCSSGCLSLSRLHLHPCFLHARLGLLQAACWCGHFGCLLHHLCLVCLSITPLQWEPSELPLIIQYLLMGVRRLSVMWLLLLVAIASGTKAAGVGWSGYAMSVCASGPAVQVVRICDPCKGASITETGFERCLSIPSFVCMFRCIMCMLPCAFLQSCEEVGRDVVGVEMHSPPTSTAWPCRNRGMHAQDVREARLHTCIVQRVHA